MPIVEFAKDDDTCINYFIIAVSFSLIIFFSHRADHHLGYLLQHIDKALKVVSLNNSL